MRKVLLVVFLSACCQASHAQAPAPAVPAPYACAPAAAACAAVAADRPVADTLHHLLEAAEHLDAAGLTAEARKLRKLAEQEREAILARIGALEAEIERLRLAIGGGQAVLVQLKMVEISRDKLRKLGFDWAAAPDDGVLAAPVAREGAGVPFRFDVVGGNDAFFGVVEALRQDGLARVLAEPTLVTMSGRPAHVHVGGEFPAPVPRGADPAAIEYKEFGLWVDVVPVVLPEGKVRMELRIRVTEITDLDRSSRAEVDGQAAPALTTREVDTGVEMELGQTVIIGGCVQKRAARSAGASTESEATPTKDADDEATLASEETELLVLVRPEIVNTPEQARSAKRPVKPAPATLRAIPAPVQAIKPLGQPRY